jgi:putative Mg2+ transporter-C (MgtC) family protein
MGATLFTLFSVRLAGGGDPARIAAQIVTGVGFLGAGAILRDAGGRVAGLTTASTIWLAAALGMGIGGGQLVLSGMATAIVLVILWAFPRVEGWIDNVRDIRTYEITCPCDAFKLREIEALIPTCGLRLQQRRQVKSADGFVCTWEVAGSPKRHEQLVEKLTAHADVRAFRA